MRPDVINVCAVTIVGGVVRKYLVVRKYFCDQQTPHEGARLPAQVPAIAGGETEEMISASKPRDLLLLQTVSRVTQDDVRLYAIVDKCVLDISTQPGGLTHPGPHHIVRTVGHLITQPHLALHHVKYRQEAADLVPDPRHQEQGGRGVELGGPGVLPLVGTHVNLVKYPALQALIY